MKDNPLSMNTVLYLRKRIGGQEQELQLKWKETNQTFYILIVLVQREVS